MKLWGMGRGKGREVRQVGSEKWEVRQDEVILVIHTVQLFCFFFYQTCHGCRKLFLVLKPKN